MRVAYVTPRYGPEVMGGAEGAARSLAEHLVADRGVEVEVYTTCATNHLSWENALPAGDDELNGVRIHRYEVAEQRGALFFALDGHIRIAPRSASDETAIDWITANGPLAPGLVEALRTTSADVVCFYPYLFWTSWAGIQATPVPRVVHPAAHDEPALYLPAMAKVFEEADAFCWHTNSERRLVEGLIPVAATPSIVLGLGTHGSARSGTPGAQVVGLEPGTPYVVSVGRVDEQKGSVMLARFFAAYKDLHPGPLKLVLVGPVSAPPPPHPDVVVAGTLSEEHKADVVADALVSISPSAMESFSLVVVEAFELGVPVMVNGTCGPTVEHAQGSGGGLAFSSLASFTEGLHRLVTDEVLRREMGEAGRRYANARFSWPGMIERYEAFLQRVVARGRRESRGTPLAPGLR